MESSRRMPFAKGGSRGNAGLEVALPSSLFMVQDEEAAVAKVVIGVDPHKRVNAVCVINAKGNVLARRQFANSAVPLRSGTSWHVVARPLS
jgi:hypothetical protein